MGTAGRHDEGPEHRQIVGARGFGPGLLCAALSLSGCYSGLDGKAALAASAGDDAGDDGADGGDGDDGSGGGDDDGAAASCQGVPPSVTPRAMRRLTPEQYANTMRDLLGDTELLLEYDDIETTPSERGIRQLRGDAEAAIARIEQWSAGLVPCDIHGAEDAACPGAAIDELAPRAFRRPITEDERAWLQAIYDETREEHDFRSGMEAMLGAILQAPAFVYLPETGTAVEGAPDTVRALDDYELASRLSYFLWDSMPDAELFAAAEAGELTTAEGLRAQAERMVLHERTEAKMQAFVYEWLGLDGGPAHFALGEQVKDPDFFPSYTPALVEAMQTELAAFVRHVVFEGSGQLEDLLTSRAAYVNGALTEHYYIVDGPVDEDTWAWVDLDHTRYSGLLTRAAFTSTYASPEVQSPIRRGVWVFENLLCGSLGEPPPNASDVPVDGGEVDGEVLSVREDVELRTSGPDCSGCHQIINPLGFAFENYDALGRWRALEITSWQPIDSSGVIVGSDVDGEVKNAIELSQKLSQSEQVHRCFATHWLEQATGGAPTSADECSVDTIQESFVANGNIRDMLVQIALSDAFRHIDLSEPAPEPEEGP